MFVAIKGDNTVDKITPTGGISTFASGLNQPDGLILANSGTFYVSNEGSGTVDKIDGSGNVSLFASGFSDPTGLALAPASAGAPEANTLVMLLLGSVLGAGGMARLRRSGKSDGTLRSITNS